MNVVIPSDSVEVNKEQFKQALECFSHYYREAFWDGEIYYNAFNNRVIGSIKEDRYFVLPRMNISIRMFIVRLRNLSFLRRFNFFP